MGAHPPVVIIVGRALTPHVRARMVKGAHPLIVRNERAHMLNAHYLAHVAPAASREMVEAHAPLHGGRVDTLCYVTAAAVAWLLTGRDVAPPFSACWLLLGAAEEGTGPADADRVIAYGAVDDDDDHFEPEHVLVALARGGRTLLLDSHWAEGRALTVRVAASAPSPAAASARYIRL